MRRLFCCIRENNRCYFADSILFFRQVPTYNINKEEVDAHDGKRKNSGNQAAEKAEKQP